LLKYDKTKRRKSSEKHRLWGKRGEDGGGQGRSAKLEWSDAILGGRTGGTQGGAVIRADWKEGSTHHEQKRGVVERVLGDNESRQIRGRGIEPGQVRDTKCASNKGTQQNKVWGMTEVKPAKV